jgi:hypothetical protein
MTPEVVWYEGQRGSWCQAIVEWLTEGFTHRMGINESKSDGAIVVVKADSLPDGSCEKFVQDTEHLKWMLCIMTGNEEGTVDIQALEGDCRVKLWLQTPHRYQAADRVLPWGWTPGCSTEIHNSKFWDWSFAGQITHKRREEFLKVAEKTNGIKLLLTTKGFAKGVSQEAYYKIIAGTKVAPCPSGPITVDSFRVCEALQLGAVPILDCVSPEGAYVEYWQRVFPHHPFEILTEWRMFPFQLDHILKNWNMVSECVQQYWTKWKSDLKTALDDDLRTIGAK